VAAQMLQHNRTWGVRRCRRRRLTDGPDLTQNRPKLVPYRCAHQRVVEILCEQGKRLTPHPNASLEIGGLPARCAAEPRGPASRGWLKASTTSRAFELCRFHH
jgi:hypothetical protein